MEGVEAFDSSDVEFYFAWRWLLPIRPNDKFDLRWISHSHAGWWARSYRVAESEQDGVLVDLSTDEGRAFDASETRGRWICAWGEGAAVGRLRKSLVGYSDIREYGLLPSVGSRVVVPFSNAKATVEGLRLHKPGRWVARLAVSLASVLARFGYTKPLRRRVLLIAQKTAGCPGGASCITNEDALTRHWDSYALYLGLPGKYRKTVVLPISPASDRVILKVACIAEAVSSLQNEVDALRTLSGSSLSRHVPVLVSFSVRGGEATLCQEYRERRRCSASIFSRHVSRFLYDLSCISRSVVRLDDILRDEFACLLNDSEVMKGLEPLRAELLRLSAANKQVFLHMSHGDFAPWNVSWTDKGIFVYDWEAWRIRDMAFSDLIYFHLAPLVHVNSGRDLASCLKAIRADIGRCSREGDYEDADAYLYLSLWLLRRGKSSPLYISLLHIVQRVWLCRGG